MEIRQAKPEEIENVRYQRVKAYEEHADALSKEHWQALKEAIMQEGDQGPDVNLLVAIKDDEIVGSVALFPAKTDAYEGYVDELDYPEIRMLAIEPKVRGKGVASALIDECVRITKEKGYSHIGLHTGEFMKGAITLYERYGFQRMPKYDFEPADDGIVVKAYALRI
ncbi:GNAT family N-acetyltransferase [Halalkalibacillus halophilus]|uniref:GNAT family N-acetyltransferase n=1 Tax=Halalkalibacillus halophilus TaxID=392827 RepID=UPI000406B5EF|nr:GNAT family N-acetyltransferase [Halalkalibacillus halophilus]